MATSPTKLKVRRQVRKHTKSANKAGDQVGEHFDKHVTSRWENLLGVKRFVASWLVLIILLGIGVGVQVSNLSALYQTEAPADGGVYIEGVVGEITNLNPVFASTAVDSSVSALLFNGLLTYDANNQLVGNLAESWELNEENTVYTVVLREDVSWHDGTAISADDVIYTIDTIQHPDTRSPLNASWQDVNAQKVDDRTVTFTLPNPFTPFVHSLTVQPLPSHILGEIPPLELRANAFNLQPRVGSGPFEFDQLRLEENVGQIELSAYADYYLGEPRLDKFIVEAFEDHDQMLGAFNDDRITAAAGLRLLDYELLDDIEAKDIIELPQYNNVMTFFNNSDPILEDRKVRRALTSATDREAIFRLLENRYAIGQGPLLPSQLGYNEDYVQRRFNRNEAESAFDKAGWKLGADGFRAKDDERLTIKIVTQSTGEYPLIVDELQKQWASFGVQLEAQLVTPEVLQQSHIVPHNYQILLANISIGVDPDVFVYWHGSQATVRGFNFSEYENDDVDAALEAGRTRDDDELRIAKYDAFLEQWAADAPAVSLYYPAYGYAQTLESAGLKQKRIIKPTDRYFNVADWTVNTETANR